MTVYEAIKYLSQFPADAELFNLVAKEPCEDGRNMSWYRIPISKMDFGVPDWHVGDRARILVEMKGRKRK